MDMYDAIEIGKAWSNLGWAQQEQAERLMQDYDIEAAIGEGELNPNALYDIRDFFGVVAAFGSDDAEAFHGEIDQWIKDWEKAGAES